MKAAQLAALAHDNAYLGKIHARAQKARDETNPSEQDKAALELVELSTALTPLRGFKAQMAYLQAFEAYAERYHDNP